jgi:NAD(P)H-dependent FMN reductase
MPLYDGDLDAREGIPEHAQRFRAELKAHQGLIIAAPEYNGSITGVLKNAIDWASRKTAEEEELACFKNKIASVVSASPGPFGGARGLIILRTLLLHLQVMIVPTTMSLPSAASAFAPDGRLADERRHAQAQNVGRVLVATLEKHLA